MPICWTGRGGGSFSHRDERLSWRGVPTWAGFRTGYGVFRRSWTGISSCRMMSRRRVRTSTGCRPWWFRLRADPDPEADLVDPTRLAHPAGQVASRRAVGCRFRLSSVDRHRQPCFDFARWWGVRCPAISLSARAVVLYSVQKWHKPGRRSGDTPQSMSGGDI